MAPWLNNLSSEKCFRKKKKKKNYHKAFGYTTWRGKILINQLTPLIPWIRLLIIQLLCNLEPTGTAWHNLQLKLGNATWILLSYLPLQSWSKLWCPKSCQENLLDTTALFSEYLWDWLTCHLNLKGYIFLSDSVLLWLSINLKSNNHWII